MVRTAKLVLLGFVLLAAATVSHAAIITYQSSLSPEVAGAAGSGSVTLEYDSFAHTLGISAVWSGLSGTTTVAHIHCCTATAGSGTAGVAVSAPTLPGFPTGTTSGTYNVTMNLWDPGSYASSFYVSVGGGTVTGAESALIAGLDAGKAYFNIHTTAFPGGEIRGFPTRVPEPGTIALLGLGLAGLVASRRRRR